jgi:hypothetical protein
VRIPVNLRIVPQVLENNELSFLRRGIGASALRQRAGREQQQRAKDWLDHGFFPFWSTPKAGTDAGQDTNLRAFRSIQKNRRKVTNVTDTTETHR